MFAFEQMEFVLLDQLNLIGENFVVVEFVLDKVFFCRQLHVRSL